MLKNRTEGSVHIKNSESSFEIANFDYFVNIDAGTERSKYNLTKHVGRDNTHSLKNAS